MKIEQAAHQAQGVRKYENKSEVGRPGRETASETTRAKDTGQSAAAVRPEISEKARTMAKAKAMAKNAPDVREQKIAELKKRIASGAYKVDAEAVADRLVDDHLQMPSGT